ncbi:hypothetical protein AXX17_AT2G36230 [Arabidopsis thaliana]|uniref:OTU domain-containing protein n=1 Tax=Arabidopsis thaliana TaxID=3702 RepID=A0A178VZC1_ARATH|nr:hypothetical protein AXX17_AT2G36230 [Arabidopsis thaliana]
MSNTQTKSLCLDGLSDREILEYRLEWENYTEIMMKSDGNCQFRALADQLYQNSDCHELVRQEIVKQLKTHPKIYKGFVDHMDFSQYVKNMSTNSQWGDEVTLRVAADVYQVKIILITEREEREEGEEGEEEQKSPLSLF